MLKPKLPAPQRPSQRLYKRVQSLVAAVIREQNALEALLSGDEEAGIRDCRLNIQAWYARLGVDDEFGLNTIIDRCEGMLRDIEAAKRRLEADDGS